MRKGEIVDSYTPLPVVLFKGVGFVPQVLDDLVLGCSSCLQGLDFGMMRSFSMFSILETRVSRTESFSMRASYWVTVTNSDVYLLLPLGGMKVGW
jgi:hypothetical protein